MRVKRKTQEKRKKRTNLAKYEEDELEFNVFSHGKQKKISRKKQKKEALIFHQQSGDLQISDEDGNLQYYVNVPHEEGDEMGTNSFFQSALFHDDDDVDIMEEENVEWVRVRNRLFTKWILFGQLEALEKKLKKKKGNAVDSFYKNVYDRASQSEKREWETLDRAREKDPAWDPMMGNNPFTLTIPAMRMSGKSTLIEELLSNRLVSKESTGEVSPIPYFHHKILIKPTAQKDSTVKIEHFDEVIVGDAENDVDVQSGEYINQAIRKIMNRKKDYRTLVVLDDILGEIGHTRHDIINRFTTRNRHHLTSVIIATQNFKSISPTIRVNTSMWMIFRIINSDERAKMLKEMEALKQFYTRIQWSKSPFTFLLIRTVPGPRILVYKGFDKYLGEVED